MKTDREMSAVWWLNRTNKEIDCLNIKYGNISVLEIWKKETQESNQITVELNGLLIDY